MGRRGAGPLVVGVDHGTLSARAVVVDAADGSVLGHDVAAYRHGVMSATLEPVGVALPPDWALQHPADHLAALGTAVRGAVRVAGVDPTRVVGVGLDATASSPLPTDAAGTPLCELDPWRDEPHAYLKLWKHHAAGAQADRITALAAARGEPWLPRYGGRYSSEWFFAKLLQVLDEAPAVYGATERFIEVTDWLVWQLTGTETRNTVTAGYKMLHQDGCYPAPDFFGALDPAFADVVATRVDAPLLGPGRRAGALDGRGAELLGLPLGVEVASANVDAHVTAAAVDACRPGVLTMIMGTSTCHILCGDALCEVPGMCGVVDGGVVPGLWAYESGQAGVGDLFGWFVDNATPPPVVARAEAAGRSLHDELSRAASSLPPGANGLLALDWWNGNRSPLADPEVSGLLVGLNLHTTAVEIYRALLEATAFGTRLIIDGFERAGVPVDHLVAAGGLPDRNPLLLQITADVTGRPVRLAASPHGPALGSAIHAAVAAGVHADLPSAASVMGAVRAGAVEPDPAAGKVYDELYDEYVALVDHFGRSGSDVMRRLRRIRGAHADA